MILVTGATGLIGRRVIRILVEKEGPKNIVCLVHAQDSPVEREGRQLIKDLGIEYFEVDLINGKGLEKAPKLPEKVFHLASITNTGVSDHSINDVGTRRLLEAIGPLSRETHLIFTSSIAVNDNRPDLSKPADENLLDPGRPSHKYGQTKRQAEKYLIQKAEEQGFRLSVIRVCAVYGDGVRPGGLFDSVKKLVFQKSLWARLNWPGRMTMINVQDLAKFLVRVSELLPASGKWELYIPAVETRTFAELSEIVHRVYGIPYRPIMLPAVVWACAGYGVRLKRLVECVVPHKLYNTFWQLRILVTDGFLNRSTKIDKILPVSERTTFENYHRRLAEKEQSEKVGA